MFTPIQYIDQKSVPKGLTYYEYKVDNNLRDFVACFWSLNSNEYVKSAEHRIIPDGCMDLIFDFSTKNSFLSGLSGETFTLNLSGEVSYLGARLYPKTVPFILGSDAKNSLNNFFDIEDFPLFRTLKEDIYSFWTIEKKIKYFENFLLSHFKNFCLKKSGEKFNNILTHITDSYGNISVETLSKTHGLSQKQISRYFKDHLGISTKPFIKIVRFQNAYKSLGIYKKSNVQLALNSGYYDQSHLLKDLNCFLKKDFI